MRERQEKIYRDADLPVQYFDDPVFYDGPRLRGVEPDQTPLILPEFIDPSFLEMVINHEPGFNMASLMAKGVKKEEDRRCVSHYIGSAGLPTAWRFFAEGAHDEVMRRRLKLPYVAADSPDHRQSTDDLMYEAGYLLSESRVANSILLNYIEVADEGGIDRQKKVVGRLAGKAALTIAAADLGDKLIEHPLSKADTQLLVRQRYLGLLQSSRQLAKVIQVVPTLDQLADYDSPLSVQLRREAPDGAWRAYHEAREIVGITNAPDLDDLDAQSLLDEEQIPALV